MADRPGLPESPSSAAGLSRLPAGVVSYARQVVGRRIGRVAGGLVLIACTLLADGCGPRTVERPLEGAPVGTAATVRKDENGIPPTLAPASGQGTPSPEPGASPRALASPSPSPVPGYVIVATDGRGANMRTGPSMTASIITTVAEGSAVEVFGDPVTAEGRAWRRIRSGGREGWVVDVVVRRR